MSRSIAALGSILVLPMLAGVPVAHAADAVDASPVSESADGEALDEPGFRWMYHGFRLGYTFVNGVGSDSRLTSPHLFVLGYELTQRYEGGSWLNVITVENLSVSGINQSLFLPSINGLVGFEIKDQIQIGTGVNFFPFDPDEKYIHQILAVGWTPPAGEFNVPVHFTFIPDKGGNWRIGATIGVNWR